MKNNTSKKPRLVYGVGFNDANYAVCRRNNKKRIWCPFYRVWIAMLGRCYNELEQKRHPTYRGCYVNKEWLVFSSFKEWMTTQDWVGKELDKDILVQGNKVYSPLLCIFVRQHINTLLVNRKAERGDYPLGVGLIKLSGKYRARCSAYGKQKLIGNYDTPEEAHEAYKKFKYKYIAEVANQQSEPLRTALLNYVIEG